MDTGLLVIFISLALTSCQVVSKPLPGREALEGVMLVVGRRPVASPGLLMVAVPTRPGRRRQVVSGIPLFQPHPLEPTLFRPHKEPEQHQEEEEEEKVETTGETVPGSDGALDVRSSRRKRSQQPLAGAVRARGRDSRATGPGLLELLQEEILVEEEEEESYSYPDYYSADPPRPTFLELLSLASSRRKSPFDVK